MRVCTYHKREAAGDMCPENDGTYNNHCIIEEVDLVQEFYRRVDRLEALVVESIRREPSREVQELITEMSMDNRF